MLPTRGYTSPLCASRDELPLIVSRQVQEVASVTLPSHHDVAYLSPASACQAWMMNRHLTVPVVPVSLMLPSIWQQGTALCAAVTSAGNGNVAAFFASLVHCMAAAT